MQFDFRVFVHADFIIANLKTGESTYDFTKDQSIVDLCLVKDALESREYKDICRFDLSGFDVCVKQYDHKLTVFLEANNYAV